MLNPITQQRFEALAGYARFPTSIPLIEVAWFSDHNERNASFQGVACSSHSEML